MEEGTMLNFMEVKYMNEKVYMYDVLYISIIIVLISK